MSLLRLDITDFRNVASARIDLLAQGFNFFYGKNGSGKSSLLEAIYYLSRGRSFRSSVNSHIIRDSSEKFSIFAQVQTNENQSIPIGLERSREGSMRIRIAGQEGVSFAELANVIPVQLINSHCFNILEGGPLFRRKYLDWGTFYSRNDFFRVWKQYERALKQRNAVLRERGSSVELEIWTVELINSAMELDALRRDFVTQLLPFLRTELDALISIPDLQLHYYPGWDPELSYQEAIAASIDKDRYIGYTQLGPHRADLKMQIHRVLVKDILSRGQQKLFICAMIVAQGAMLQHCVNRKPIYLMDDMPSELDHQSRANLMALLLKQEAQVFLTAVEYQALADSCADAPMKMFHVEHGAIQAHHLPLPLPLRDGRCATSSG